MGLKIKIFSTLFLFILSIKSFALVDYGESALKEPPATSGAPGGKTISRQSAPVQKSSPSGQGGPSGLFNFSSEYESLNVGQEFGDGKISFYKFQTHFQTPYDLFLDASFWLADSSSSNITSTSKTETGNPLIKIGFNWLRIGDASNLAMINILAGGSFKSGNGQIASTRTDQIFGVETSKRFVNLVLGIGYELRVVGDPELEEEQSIGNIQTILASIGWRATSDISFALEGATVKIGNALKDERANKLMNDLSFGYASPKMLLGISPLIELELGALFRTKRLRSTDQLIKARLWDLKGAYGNSLFTGLNIAI